MGCTSSTAKTAKAQQPQVQAAGSTLAEDPKQTDTKVEAAEGDVAPAVEVVEKGAEQAGAAVGSSAEGTKQTSEDVKEKVEEGKQTAEEGVVTDATKIEDG